MPCYRPREGWRARRANPSGKRPIVFNRRDGFEDLPVTVPCGQCIGCRLERSRQWAIRCIHEASLYDENAFLTLTYDDAHLPQDGSLDKSHYQLFMKRLRARIEPRRVRFFHCGEYGSRTWRPHYHALLFGYDFPDKIFYTSKGGNRLWISELLNELWGQGFCTIGDVTFESAAYVARYIVGKVTGDQADEHYQSVDPETGEVFRLQPEYVTMSRRPGIGKPWYDKFKDDVFPDDYIIIRGRKMRPPRFYDSLYAQDVPRETLKLKRDRIARAMEYEGDNTSERLRAREKVKQAQAKTLKRSVD